MSAGRAANTCRFTFDWIPQIAKNRGGNIKILESSAERAHDGTNNAVQGGKHARTCRICDRDDAVKPSSLFSEPARQLFECYAAGKDRDDAVKLSSL